MRRGITRALSPSCQRREVRIGRKATLLCVGLLISQQCYSAEIFLPRGEKTLLTTNVVWQGFTNVSRFEASRLISSNALWISFTNMPPFQTGTLFRLSPFDRPGTNSTKEQWELLLKLKERFNLLQEQAPSNRLGDYWVPGEFQRIMGRPIQLTPLSPWQP